MNSLFNSRVIPKELLKFRLDKQLGRLKETIEADKKSENAEEEDKFQLYQRILSWFIMGRLAKSEYDGILANILINPELIELHNKVIELLRAIYCDSSLILVTSTSGSVDVNGTFSSLDSFLNSFEFNLLPPEENYEKEEKQKFEDEGEEIIEIEMSPNTRKFNTSIENLGFTPSEEALISEAMRNPIHEIASNERDTLIPGVNYKKGFDVNFDCGNRSCTELSSLPDQNLMKSRFFKVASSTADGNSYTPTISDSIAVLACKSLEDYMKNLLENAATLKFGHKSLLRPPISYIFPIASEEENKFEGESEKFCGKITEKDLYFLFKLKPWLLADMESDLVLDELFK